MPNIEPYIQSPFNKQRKDKFLLVLNLPDALKSISKKFIRTEDNINFDTLQFSVYGSVVPDINIPKLDISYSGQTLTTSSLTRPPYDPVTVNFTVDNRFNNYWVIYSWLNLLNDAATGLYDKDNLTQLPARRKTITTDFNAEYKSNISIYALDEYNKRVAEFRYLQAFPVSLGGISFNYRTPDEVETTFTFAFAQLVVNLQENVDTL